MGEMHGKGEYIKAGAEEIYEGEFQLNVRQGQGKLTNADGDIITGTFDKGRPHGEELVAEFANGDKYEGQMQEGQFTGEGKLAKFDTKSIYTGSF